MGGSLLGRCNSPSIHDLLSGPLTRLGWGVLHFLQWGFSFPHAHSASPLLPPPGLRTASTRAAPLPCTGEEAETTKGEVSCPGQGWVCFVDTRLGGRGLCPLRAGGLPLLNTSVLLITPFRCLRFLVRAHLEGLLRGGGGRLDGEEARKPPAPPREVRCLSNLRWRGMRACLCHLQRSCTSSLHPESSGHLHARQLKFQCPPYLGQFSAQESWGRPCRNLRVRNTPSHSALSSEAC